MNDERAITRKQFLVVALVLPVAACSTDGAATGSLPPTPPCSDGDDDATPAQTEGPYFRTGSPERTSLLEADTKGPRLTITGVVYSTSCRPVPRALLDFWQADADGAYDNTGHGLRGHQYTDGQGRFTLTTVVPGLYPGRTRHIHVKVQAPGRDVLTTQLYFPGETRNEDDDIFKEALLLRDVRKSSAQTAVFDFVLDV